MTIHPIVVHGFKVVFYGYALAFSALLTYVLSDALIRPIEPVRLTILNPDHIVESGGTLDFSVEFHRTKMCRTHINRFILREQPFNGNGLSQNDAHYQSMLRDGTHSRYEVLFRQEVPAVLLIGHDVDISSIRIPALPEGQYQFKQFVISECSFITRVDEYPAAQITVVAKRQP